MGLTEPWSKEANAPGAAKTIQAWFRGSSVFLDKIGCLGAKRAGRRGHQRGSRVWQEEQGAGQQESGLSSSSAVRSWEWL